MSAGGFRSDQPIERGELPGSFPGKKWWLQMLVFSIHQLMMMIRGVHARACNCHIRVVLCLPPFRCDISISEERC